MTDENPPQPKSASEAVARWWAEQLGAPTFKATDDRSSAEDRSNMEMAGMLAQLAVGSGVLTDEQTSTFVEALAETVETALQRGMTGVFLGVDYGPDRELAEAAERAGISLNRFPWKTHTYATADYVTVALGYGSMPRLIWTAPGWERPTCESRRYTADWSQKLPEVCGLPQFHEEREHGSWIPKAVNA